MKSWVLVVALSGCVTTPPVPEPVVEKPIDVAAAPRAAVDAFLAAVDAKNFDDVHALLTKALRDRYDVGRLKNDFELEPNARARVDAIRAARSSPFQVNDSSASLALHHDRKLRLVREDAEWKIASLE